MDTLPPLPDGADPAEVHRAIAAAAARLSTRLAQNPPPTPALERWRPGGLPRFAEPLLTIILEMFPADSSVPDLDPARRFIRELAADRARAKLPPDHAVKLTFSSSRDLTRLAADEVREEIVDRHLADAVVRRMEAVGDLLAADYLTAFMEETSLILAEQEELGAHVLATTRAGIAIGDEDGHVVYANDAFGKYFGGMSGDVIGRRWEDVLPLGQLQAGGDGLSPDSEAWLDTTVVDQLGEEHVVRVSLHPVGRRLQVVAVDVSYQVRFGQMRREFVHGLLHDLRSPIAVVSGWARTLLQDSGDLDAATRRAGLESIEAAAGHVSQMTENLLELELLEGGGQSLDVEAFPPLERLERLVEESEVPAQVYVEGTPSLVRADTAAFDRIVRNLIENSRSHGTPPVSLTITHAGDHVRIHVTDSGTIDAEVAEAAFNGRVPSRGGFGIGLRTTVLLARAQGGDVGLSSTDPTTFTLRLPSAPSQETR